MNPTALKQPTDIIQAPDQAPPPVEETPIKTTKKMKAMDAKSTIQYVRTLQRYRLTYEADWYRCFYAYENNVFIGWDRAAQTIVKIPYRKRFFINLPEVKKQADNFENLLLQFMPLFVVYPTNIADEKARTDARNLSRRLKQCYLDWAASSVIHKYVHNAIKYPVSFLEVSVEKRIDNSTGKIKNTVVPRVADAFDYLFDPRIEFEDNPMIVKIVRRTLKEIKDYKDIKEPKVLDSTAHDMIEDMKEVIFQSKYGPRGEEGDMRTVVTYQVMEKTSEGIIVRVLDMSGNELSRKEYPGINFYPVVPLQLSSGDMYQPSFVSNMIPIARALSLIANRIEDFILKFVRGAYLVREGSDVTFSDENGIVVKFEGEQPTVMQVPILQPAIVNWFNKLFDLAERYGINSIAGGGTPRGSQNRSAKMMDKSVQNQQGQQKTPLDNLMMAFKKVAEITIFYLSEYTDEPTSETFRDQGNDYEGATFIGEKYKAKDPKATVIPKTIDRMEIDVEDASSTSIENKRKDVLALALEFAKVPPPFQKVLLDLYRVGPTSDILEDLEKAQTLLDNPEFQNLIEQARQGNLDPRVKQALGILLNFLGQQSPVKGPDQMNPVGGGKPSTPADGGATPADKPADNGGDKPSSKSN